MHSQLDNQAKVKLTKLGDSKHRLKSQIVEIATVSHELEEKVCVCVCVCVCVGVEGGGSGEMGGSLFQLSPKRHVHEGYGTSQATTVNA